MAKRVKQSVFCALMAVGAFTLSPVFAQESTPVVAALPAPAQADPMMDRAVNLIHESQTAHQRQIRRSNVRQAQPDKVVRSGHTYILGIDGACALPM
jgi:hypothetical protein